MTDETIIRLFAGFFAVVLICMARCLEKARRCDERASRMTSGTTAMDEAQAREDLQRERAHEARMAGPKGSDHGRTSFH